MDNTVMLGLQAAVAAAAVDASAGMTAVPEGSESFSSVLASQTAQNSSGVQDNSAVQDSQAAEGSPVEETNTVGNLSLKKEDENDTNSALGVILDLLEYTEDDGTLKGMKILAKAVLNAMMGDSSRKKKTDLFAFLGEGYDVFADDYNLFLTGTEMLSQIGIALKADLMAAEKKNESGLLFFTDTDADEDFMSPIDEIISNLDKIIKKLYSADDDTDENTAAEALAAMLGIPADTDLDYVLTPVKEQAIESAAEVLTSAKEIVAAANPEDVPKMEQHY